MVRHVEPPNFRWAEDIGREGRMKLEIGVGCAEIEAIALSPQQFPTMGSAGCTVGVPAGT
jgi:hypothetical protein